MVCLFQVIAASRTFSYKGLNVLTFCSESLRSGLKYLSQCISIIALRSGALNLVNLCSPNKWSSNLETGYETGYVIAIKHFTSGIEHTAIYIWLGPIHILYGITSPKNSTAVTEIRIAYHEGTNLSKKIGRASKAQALQSKRVTRTWCCYLTRVGWSFSAYFFCFSISLSLLSLSL